MDKKLKLREEKTSVSAVCGLVLLFFFFALKSSIAISSIPDDQKAVLTIAGAGLKAGEKVFLATGAGQKISADVDKDGNFRFSNLGYFSFENLKFSLDTPANNSEIIYGASGNHLEFSYDGRESLFRISGTIGQFGTAVIGVDGSEETLSQVAGAGGGWISMQTRSDKPFAAGETKVVASIINVGLSYSNVIVPTTPVTLTLVTSPIGSVSSPVSGLGAKKVLNTEEKKEATPAVPYTSPDKSQSEPVKPETNSVKPESDKKEKVHVPYVVQGRIEFKRVFSIDDDFSAAAGIGGGGGAAGGGISFSDGDFERTYVGGLKQVADEIRNAILLHAASVGAMLDGRTFMSAMRQIQLSSADSLVNYQLSDTICRFGTLSRSLAATQEDVEKNKVGFAKALSDRTNQKYNTVHSNPGNGVITMTVNFQNKYCDPVGNSMFLAEYCNATPTNTDLYRNMDVNFTQTFDLPLTLDADYSASTLTPTQDNLMQLFYNLSYQPPYTTDDEKGFDTTKDIPKTQEMRAIMAARQVSGNTFASLVGEKTKGAAQSAGYMRAVLLQLGVPDADAKKLIGDNPSYFAQMEIMTKKIFQDPAFYANLYDGPANVDRQRVAMKAVELQQQRDLLESLRRREMLLSVYLDMKLRDNAGRVNQSTVLGTAQK